MNENGIQICFCAGNGKSLPSFPLEAHESFCLVWDWTAANGKITPQQHLAKLEEATAGLGITQDELDREMADLDSAPPGFVPGLGPVSGLAMRMFSDFKGFRQPGSDSKCYRASAGMVHVKPECRCPRYSRYSP